VSSRFPPPPKPYRRPRRARRPALLGALAIGLVTGTLIGLSAKGPASSSVLRPLEPASPAPQVQPVRADTLLAWTPGELPAGWGKTVGRIRGVEHAVSVVSGTAWLSSSFSADGARVDLPPAGLTIPIEVAGADLASYQPFMSPSDRSFLPALARREAVMGVTEAAIRHLGPGATLVFGNAKVRVAGIVPDAEIGAHEIFMARSAANRLGIKVARYLLVDPGARTSRRRLTSRMRATLPPGLPLRVRGPGETPFFRQGDAVLPPVQLKELFGEFAARPTTGGFLVIDSAWVRTHIVNATVPVLGTVTCNRAIIPQLRGALAEIEREGLSRLIPRRDYAGCYSSRFINRNPEAGISHHAWGVAFDVNVSRNPFGRTPHQDPRVVAIFEQWGFTWGGRWLRPDGMHFEFVRFPTGA